MQAAYGKALALPEDGKRKDEDYQPAYPVHRTLTYLTIFAFLTTADHFFVSASRKTSGISGVHEINLVFHFFQFLPGFLVRSVFSRASSSFFMMERAFWCEPKERCIC